MPNALAPAPTERSTALELDNLDVYRVSLEFQGLIATILSSAHGELRSQLDRAALSPWSARRSSMSWRVEPSLRSAIFASALAKGDAGVAPTASLDADQARPTLRPDLLPVPNLDSKSLGNCPQVRIRQGPPMALLSRFGQH